MIELGLFRKDFIQICFYDRKCREQVVGESSESPV